MTVGHAFDLPQAHCNAMQDQVIEYEAGIEGHSQLDQLSSARFSRGFSRSLASSDFKTWG